MNGEIDIVTRRTLKPDSQVNAEKEKNGGAKLEAGSLSNQDPLDAERPIGDYQKTGNSLAARA